MRDNSVLQMNEAIMTCISAALQSMDHSHPMLKRNACHVSHACTRGWARLLAGRGNEEVGRTHMLAVHTHPGQEEQQLQLLLLHRTTRITRVVVCVLGWWCACPR